MKNLLSLIKNKKALVSFSRLESKIKDKDSLFAASTIFLIGTVIASLFNFLYQFWMIRNLSTSDLGIFGSLFKIIYIASFSTLAFTLTMSKFAAEYHGRDEKGLFKLLVRKSLFYVIILGLVLLGIYLLLVPYIASFLKIESYTGLILVGVVSYLSIISALAIGALNGIQKFVWQNISVTGSALIKFILGVVLVYLGFGVIGAIVALLIGALIGIFVTIFPISKSFKKDEIKKELGEKNEKIDINTRKITKYFLIIFFILLIPTLMITFDQLLVKHYLSSEQAGLYFAAQMIGSVIWFGSGFLVGPLFPKVVSSHLEGKDTSRLLFKALTYTGFLVFIGCLVYFIIPTFIVSVIYGQAYLSIAPMIGIFGVAMGLYSLIQILIVYNIAKERYHVFWFVLIGFLIEMVGIYFFHSSIEEVIKIFFVANIFNIGSLLIYNWKEVFQSEFFGRNGNSKQDKVVPDEIEPIETKLEVIN
ncbi:MAG: oligosaccharide flippase family protein [Candidatus Pacearchaeota archaeon]|jgi:O-antigen/teichoic acid export membrane protein